MVRWGNFKYQSCVHAAHAQLQDTWAIWMYDLFILGATEPGEALEIMVELCLWPSIILLHKLAIYCNCIWYMLRTIDYYLLGLQYMEKCKANCILILRPVAMVDVGVSSGRASTPTYHYKLFPLLVLTIVVLYFRPQVSRCSLTGSRKCKLPQCTMDVRTCLMRLAPSMGLRLW
jgi:hypothetical protein